MTNKKILYSLAASALFVLLLAMLLPSEGTGRAIAAFLLIPIALLSWIFLKKRSIPSMHYKQIIMLCAVFGVVYVVLYYLTGLAFEFYYSPYSLSLTNFFNFILPISVIVVCSEMIRLVIRAQDDKLADRLCYLICVLSEALIYGNIYYIVTFNRFMDFVGLTIFPAVIANLLYHYLSKRYGMYPNIVYRLITSLYIYFIPILPKMADSLFALYNLAFPIIIYFFIDALYEKKLRYALVKKSKLTIPITVIAVSIILGLVMLISNQFRYGALVIATPSMTGELNQGDAAIFERYDDQEIVEGQVIVFEDNDTMVVHRVADIKRINGVTRY